MASLSAIRDALRVTLDSIDGLYVHDTMPQVIQQLPAVAVLPVECDFAKVAQRGSDGWQLDLYVLVSSVDWRRAQDQLDALVSGGGAGSIRQAIYDNASLGLADGTDATARGVRGYGGSFDVAAVKHIGAIVRVDVLTPGME